MELEKIRQALHLLTDALIDALAATEEDITATKPARRSAEGTGIISTPTTQAAQHRLQETAEAEAKAEAEGAAAIPEAMDFSVFNTELRNLSVQMGPGKMGSAIQPLLAKYAPEGGGIGGVPEQQREAFLNEARTFVQGATQ